MVGKQITNVEEIRTFVKVRSKLGCSLKELFAEITRVYGSSKVSYETVRRWKKNFDSGEESIKNAPKSGRPVTASCNKNILKITELLKNDARYTVRDIARIVGISLATVHFVLKKS